MEPKILQATTEDAGQRIDSFLASQLEGVSRSASVYQNPKSLAAAYKCR